ncbi:unnamed protein product [Coregonus sp. 'balchen']|nr:unnamed protein product [Coregonus sp. 'balchen']
MSFQTDKTLQHVWREPVRKTEKDHCHRLKSPGQLSPEPPVVTVLSRDGRTKSPGIGSHRTKNTTIEEYRRALKPDNFSKSNILSTERRKNVKTVRIDNCQSDRTDIRPGVSVRDNISTDKLGHLSYRAEALREDTHFINDCEQLRMDQLRTVHPKADSIGIDPGRDLRRTDIADHHSGVSDYQRSKALDTNIIGTSTSQSNVLHPWQVWDGGARYQPRSLLCDVGTQTYLTALAQSPHSIPGPDTEPIMVFKAPRESEMERNQQSSIQQQHHPMATLHQVVLQKDTGPYCSSCALTHTPALKTGEAVKRASVRRAIGQPIRLHRLCAVGESSEHCSAQLRVIGDEVNSMFSKGKVGSAQWQTWREGIITCLFTVLSGLGSLYLLQHRNLRTP